MINVRNLSYPEVTECTVGRVPRKGTRDSHKLTSISMGLDLTYKDTAQLKLKERSKHVITHISHCRRLSPYV